MTLVLSCDPAGERGLEAVLAQAGAALATAPEVAVRLGPGTHRITRPITVVIPPGGGLLDIVGDPAGTTLSGSTELGVPRPHPTEWQWVLDASAPPRCLTIDGLSRPWHRVAVPEAVVRAEGLELGAGASSVRGWSGAELVLRMNWVEHRLPVHDVVDGLVLTDPDAWACFQSTDGRTPGQGAWVDNADVDELDPGTWRFDPATGVLRYRPAPDDRPDAVAEVGGAETLLHLSSEDGHGRVRVANLTLRGTDWRRQGLGERCWVGLQANFGQEIAPAGSPEAERDDNVMCFLVRGLPAAVELDRLGAADVVSCGFRGLGGDGLRIGRGSSSVTVQACSFEDIAASGIVVGDPRDHHPAGADVVSSVRIADCCVRDIGVQYSGSVGIVAAYVDGLTVEHNLLERLPYTAISVGWGWGLVDDDAGTPSRDVIVRANRVHDVMRTLIDGGAVYTLGRMPGSEVCENVIDLIRAPYGALYLDQGSAGIDVHHNVVWDVEGRAWIANIASDGRYRENWWDDGHPRGGMHSCTVDLIDNTTIRDVDEAPAGIVEAAGPRGLGVPGSGG